jgi:hypothetical protein
MIENVYAVINVDYVLNSRSPNRACAFAHAYIQTYRPAYSESHSGQSSPVISICCNIPEQDYGYPITFVMTCLLQSIFYLSKLSSLVITNIYKTRLLPTTQKAINKGTPVNLTSFLQHKHDRHSGPHNTTTLRMQQWKMVLSASLILSFIRYKEIPITIPCIPSADYYAQITVPSKPI